MNTITVSRTVVTKLRNPNTVSVTSSSGSENELSTVELVLELVVVVVADVWMAEIGSEGSDAPAAVVRREVDEVKIGS